MERGQKQGKIQCPKIFSADLSPEMVERFLLLRRVDRCSK